MGSSYLVSLLVPYWVLDAKAAIDHSFKMEKHYCSFFFFLKILFIHEREAETQAEGEAGSLRGAQCGTAQDHTLSQRQMFN